MTNFGPNWVNFNDFDHLSNNSTKNDHFMIDIECLAACGSKVAKFHHPDFLNFEFWYFRWPFSGYHIQVMNRENDPK